MSQDSGSQDESETETEYDTAWESGDSDPPFHTSHLYKVISGSVNADSTALELSNTRVDELAKLPESNVIGATQTVSSSGLQGSAQTVSFFSTPFSNASVGTKPAVFDVVGNQATSTVSISGKGVSGQPNSAQTGSFFSTTFSSANVGTKPAGFDFLKTTTTTAVSSSAQGNSGQQNSAQNSGFFSVPATSTSFGAKTTGVKSGGIGAQLSLNLGESGTISSTTADPLNTKSMPIEKPLLSVTNSFEKVELQSTLSSLQCDICLRLQVTKQAAVWCFECNELLCDNCEQNHSVQNISKQHKPTTVQDYLNLSSSVTSLSHTCQSHNFNFYFYCVDHDEPCCVKCVTDNHKSCSNMKPLSEVTKNVKESSLFTDLQERAKDIKDIVQNLIKDVSPKKEKVKDEKQRIISIVTSTRKAINQHLDCIQEMILRTVDQKEEKEREQITRTIKNLEDLLKGANLTLHNLSQAGNHASEFHTYFGIIKWRDEIKQCEDNLLLLQRNLKQFERFDIKVNQKLLDIRSDVQQFAALESERTMPTVKLLQKERQGQALIPNPMVKPDIKLKREHFLTLPRDECYMDIYGCCITELGSMVFSDYNNYRLILVNIQGKFKNINLSFAPYDVSVVDNDTVAVTNKDYMKLALIDISHGKVVRKMDMGDRYYGLYYIDGKFFISVGKLKFIVMNVDGNVPSKINKVDYATACFVENECLYYAAHKADTVYCCDMTGKVMWKYACDKGDYPVGITADVFVSCSHANKIICINNNGKESKVLLTGLDGLNKPHGISYSKRLDSLLVSNRADGKCTVYKIIC